MRGSFTAGVLDFFMKQGIYLPYVIGVSAGAANGVNYLAKQPGRYQECTKRALTDYRYVSALNFFRKKGYFDLDVICDILPYKLPLDFSRIFSSKQKLLFTLTDCETGKACFMEEKKDEKRLMNLLRASCSLPFVSPVVKIDGRAYLDGGIADSIPIKKARKDGYRRNVVILTRDKGYRKPDKHIAASLYRRYPALSKAIKERAGHYNKTLDVLSELEKKGEVFLFRPESEVTISRAEKDVFRIECLYWDGYNHAKRNYDRFLAWL